MFVIGAYGGVEFSEHMGEVICLMNLCGKDLCPKGDFVFEEAFFGGHRIYFFLPPVLAVAWGFFEPFCMRPRVRPENPTGWEFFAAMGV